MASYKFNIFGFCRSGSYSSTVVHDFKLKSLTDMGLTESMSLTEKNATTDHFMY